MRTLPLPTFFLAATLVLARPASAQSNVAVLQHDGTNYGKFAGGQPNLAPRMAIAQRFYQTHADAYDFLVVFPAFDSDFDKEALGLHTPVRNAVTGNGQLVFDNGSFFGSAGRLKAYIDVASLAPGTPDGSADAALAILAHEVAHTWSGAAHFRDPLTGSISSDLLGQEGAHWSFFLDSNASVLYGSKWQDVGGGAFAAVESQKRYSDLDLYLAGFLDPSEVQDFSLLVPAPGETHLATDLPPPDGTRVGATARTLHIGDVIAAEGPRVPAAGSAQTVYRAAFALLLAPGQQATQAQRDYIDAVRRAWESQFFFLTRGRAVMETNLVEEPPASVSQIPGVTAGLSFLLGAQHADGSWSDQPESTMRDTELAEEALRLFPGAAGVQGAMTAGNVYASAAQVVDMDSAARRALALSASGSTLADVTAAVPASAVPPGLTSGYASTIIDAVLEAAAQRARGGVDAGLLSFLLSKQNADGGWPFLAGGPSRIEPTLWMLQVLDHPLPSALSWLAGLRQADGAYRDGAESNGDTALALIALAKAGALAPADASLTASWLLARQEADGSWDESVPATALALQGLRAALTPNLRIGPADLSAAPASVLDGERFTLTVVVHNDGYADVQSVAVAAFDDTGNSFGPQVVLPVVPAGSSAVATLALDSTGHGGSQAALVMIDPSGVIDETSRADNHASVPFTVQQRPSGPELFVTPAAVAVSPASIARSPAAVTVDAMIGNLGQAGAQGVAVALLADGHEVGRTLVDVSAGGSAIAHFDASVTPAGLAVVLSVVVDPDGAILESTKANNRADVSVPVEQSVALAVSPLQLSAGSLAQGSDLSIQYSVANSGTAMGSAQAVVTILAGQSVVAQLPAVSFPVAPGASVARTAVWRANTAGSLVVQVAVTPGASSATAALAVTPSDKANLHLGAGGFSISPNPPLQSGDATLSASIANGGGPAGPFAVDFYLGDPAQGGQKLYRQLLPGLDAGGSITVTAPFSPQTASQATLVLVIDAANQVDEFDESDNTAVLVVTPLSLPDLRIADGDVQPSSLFPRPGDRLSVAVDVHNDGKQAAPAAQLELFDGDPASGARLGSTRLDMPASGTASWTFQVATASWTGTHTLVAVVNGDAAIRESSTSNNRGSRTVTIQAGPVALSEPFFSPNGDGVKDTTSISFRQSVPQPITMLVAGDHGVVRVLKAEATTGGSLTWDGRDDEGRVVRDGSYRIDVFAGPGNSATLLGSAIAVVDDNRSPVTSASSDEVVERDLWPIVAPGQSPFNYGIQDISQIQIQPANDDSGVLVAHGNVVFVQPLDGSAAIPMTSWLPIDGFNMVGVGAQGQLAFNDYWCYRGCHTQVYDPATQRLFDADLGQPFPDGSDTALEPVFSPDGQRLLVGGLDKGVWEFDLTGAQPPALVLPLHSGTREYYNDYQYSPDGRQVAVYDSDNARVWVAEHDGSGQRLVDPGTFTPDGFTDFSTQFGRLITWSPDGASLSYFSREGIVSVAAAGGTPTVQRIGETEWYTFAPDSLGDAIVYSPITAVNELWRLDRYTGARRRMIRTSPIPSPYSWDHGRDLQSDSELVSPQGSFILVFKQYGLSAVQSVLNLVVDLDARRDSGATALQLIGTAADVNFESYELAARRYHSTDPFVAFANSTQPVVKGLLGEWAPPTPGLWEVQLTAHDKAGNTSSAVITVAGPTQQPRIAQVRVDPAYISPNGDGVQDAAIVSYHALEAVTTTFTVTNAAGTVVRTFPVTKLDAGDYHDLVWDGRDDAFLPVPDGTYTLHAEGGYALPVVVDTTPPLVTVTAGPGQLPLPFTPFTWMTVVGTPDVGVDFTWKATDEHPFATELQQSSEGPDTGFVPVAQGFATAGDDLQLAVDARGKWVRAHAVDLAGNEWFSPPVAVDNAMAIIAIGTGSDDSNVNFEPADGVLGSKNTYVLNYQDLARRFAPARYIFALRWSFAGAPVAISGTLENPLVDVHDLPISLIQTNSPTDAVPDAFVAWDASSMDPRAFDRGGILTLRVTDQAGVVHQDHVSFKNADERGVGQFTGVCVAPGRQILEVDGEWAGGQSVSIASSSGTQTVYPAGPGAIPFDVSSLQGCFGSVRAGDKTGSETLGAFDICALFAKSVAVEGTTARLELASTMREPLQGPVDVLAAPVEEGGLGPWARLETLTVAQASAPTANVDLSTLPPGAKFAFALAAPGHNPKLCDYAQATVPPFDLTLGDVQRDPAPVVACTARSAAVWTIPVQAHTTSGLQISSVTAKAVAGDLSEVPLPITGFTPGAQVDAQIVFATVGLPEGRYTVRAFATRSDGQVAEVTTKPGNALVVDRSPPVATLVAPADGAVVCARRVPARDGSFKTLVDATAFVADAALSTWTMTLASASGPTVATAQGADAAGLPFVGNVDGMLDVTGSSTAQYELSLEARDTSGNSSCAVPHQIDLVQPVLLTGVAALPAVFSPDPAGAAPTVQLQFEVDAPAHLDVTIPTATVPAASADVGAGQGAILWDGTSGGTVLPDGDYVVTLDASDRCSNHSTGTASVSIDTLPPVVRIDAPVAGSTAGTVLAVRGSITDAHLTGYSLGIAPAGNPQFTTLLTRAQPDPSGDLGTVALGALAPGPWVLQVTANDVVGHHTTVSVPFSVIAPAALASLSVTPDAVSPGHGPASTAQIGLLAPAAVTLTIASPAGQTVATVADNAVLAAGTSAISLDAAVSALPDGSYMVVAVSGTESAGVPLLIDRVVPSVSVASPTPFVRGSAPVALSVSDVSLVSWNVTLDSQQAIASGTSAVAGVVASLRDLAEGPHSILVHAVDRAGNERQLTVPFTSDTVAPSVSFVSPQGGDSLRGIFTVGVTAADANLSRVTVTATDAANTVTTIFDAASATPFSWDTALFDGPVGLDLVAIDQAGNRATAHVAVQVDNHPPVALLQAPRDAFLKLPARFSGTASDDHLASWKLSLGNGLPAVAHGFVEIASGTGVVSGLFTELPSLPADGDYTARLEVVDRAGNVAIDTAGFSVDTTPPAAPGQPLATVQNGRDVRLDWTASVSPDVESYAVQRASGTGDFAEIGTATSVTTFVDGNRADGQWRYRVIAIDQAGNRGAPSPEVSVAVDATPPSVSIISPVGQALLSATVPVSGSATKADHFGTWTLSAGAGVAPSSFQTLAAGSAAVFGPLGSFDTRTLPDGDAVLRLQATSVSGTSAETRVAVIIDNTPPAAPVLTDVQDLGADVQVNWVGNVEADLAGYLVYRNGSPLGLPAGRIVSVLPYLSQGPSYLDSGAPDGSLTYQVQAVDRAGNLSLLSNGIPVTRETRAPRANISQPFHLARIQGVTEVIADVKDLDVQSVRFDARSGTTDFQTIGTATQYPYSVQIDPATLTSSVIELRAVATDTSGNTDPSPAVIAVFADPDLIPLAAAVHVDGTAVQLSWTDPNGAGRVAGVRGERDAVAFGDMPAVPSGSATTSDAASGSADGIWNGYGGWTPATLPGTWTVNFDAPAIVENIDLQGADGVQFDLLAHIQGSWIALQSGLAMSGGSASVALPQPLLLDGLSVRVTQNGPPGSTALSHVGISQPPQLQSPVGAPSQGGENSYALVAMSPFGGEARSQVTALVYVPTVDALPDYYAANAVVTGGNVPAGATVNALSTADGTIIGSATAGLDGRYSVPLSVPRGMTWFAVQAIDVDGNNSEQACCYSVTWDPPPVAVPSLAAIATASSVTLAFSLTGSTDGVAGYHLYRAPQGGAPQLIATLDAAATTFVDGPVSNGTYSYAAAAVSAHGDEGPTSAPASVQVQIQPPDAPTGLAITAPPQGSVLQLAWTTPSAAPVSYAVERKDALHPYTSIGTSVTATATTDATVANGVIYTYRVFALDAAGNRSAPSNEASGTANDTIPPGAPDIRFPAAGGSSVTLSSGATVVSGVGDPGSTVEVFLDGASVGTSTVSTATPAAALQTTYRARSIDVAPHGERIAYSSNVDGHSVIVVESPAAGQVQTISGPPDATFGRVAFSPDGSQVAAEMGTQGLTSIVLGHVDAAGVKRLTPATTSNQSAPAWSADGRRVAYITSDAAADTVVAWADPTEGMEHVAWSDPVRSTNAANWVAHDAALAFVAAGSSPALVSVDAQGGSETELLAAPVLLSTVAIAPMGRSIAVVSGQTAYDTLSLIDVTTGSATVVGAAGQIKSAPSFSPDGTLLAYASVGRIVTQELATHALVDRGALLDGSDSDAPQRQILWRGLSSLTVFESATGYWRVHLPGIFSVPSVQLPVGDSTLVAVAHKEPGNLSAPSQAVQLHLDGSLLPDLAVSVATEPATLQRGEPANAVITVRNQGAATEEAPEVGLALFGQSGVIWSPPLLKLADSIPAGGEASAVVPLDLTMVQTGMQLQAVVDPGDKIPDSDRANNTATLPLIVLDGSALVVQLALTNSKVNANGTVVATAQVLNGGPPRDVVLHLSIVDRAGGVVAVATDAQFSALGTLASSTAQRSFSIGTTLAGSYLVLLEASGSDGSFASASAPLEVVPDRSTLLTMETTQATYGPQDDVAVVLRGTNQSVNALLIGATWSLSATDAAGNVAFSSTGGVPLVSRGGSFSAVTDLGSLRPGTYSLQGTVQLGSQQLASAAGSFEVVGAPVLEGGLELAGVHGDPPAFPSGSDLPIHYGISNSGTAAAAGVLLHVGLLDPDTMQLVASDDVPLGPVAIAESDYGTFTAPTAALALKTYAVVLSADHDGLAQPEVLATRSVRIADSTPPTLVLLNLAQGGVVRGTAAPQVRAVDDASGVAAVRVSVDGAQPVPLSLIAGSLLDGVWSANLGLGADGLHTLVFSGADAEGNDGFTSPGAANPLAVQVVSDSTPPQISIVGVADGALLATAPAPAFTVTDVNLSTVVATLNGLPFSSGTAVDMDGDYQLLVEATDRAANTATASLRFTVDQSPPSINIVGISDGEFAPGPLLPLVSVFDAHPGTVAVALDGSPYVAGTPVELDGPHFLTVDAVDALGNASHAQVGFDVDNTPPVVSIAGVSDGAYVAADVTPTVTATDENLFGVFAMLDGAPFTVGTPISLEGPHTFKAIALDKAGNQGFASVSLTLDKTPPVIAILGITNGLRTNASVAPSFSATDLNLASVQATLNGAPFVSGTAILAEGSYTLAVTAVDKAGNTAQSVVSFAIDRTPPIVSITGIADGALVDSGVTPVVSSPDRDIASLTTTLNGAAFAAGSSVTAEGDYTLLATATDVAGNQTTAQVKFTIDLTPPLIALSGVQDGAFFAHAVAPIFSTTDAHPGPLQASLNGQPFVSGTAVAAEGNYILSVTAADGAGNHATQTAAFVIDTTPPVVSIGGVSDGAFVSADVSPAFSASDPNLLGVQATLNGAPFTSGTISSEGAYTLAVSAQDKAGNTASRAVSFVIDKTPPSIGIAGVTNGQLTNQPVTPSYSATDANLASVSATLNGQPFVSGTTIAAEGSYTLVAAALDRAGNQAQATVQFVIHTTPPAISIGGFVDGGVVNTGVTPTWSSNSSIAVTLSATLNGSPISPGTLVSLEGGYSLTVTSTDQAGNTATRTATFTIDETPPAITIAGVTDGAFYNAQVVPAFAATDLHLASVAGTLNGAPFLSGQALSSEGAYSLSVVASDMAGNRSTRTLSFVVDLTPPALSISGFKDGDITSANVTPAVSATDANLASVSVTLDGQPFVSGTPVTTEGPHAVSAIAVDQAGNSTSRSGTFTIDRTPPVISIAGVTDGARTNLNVTPVFGAQDANLASVQATLNGAAFNSGSVVSAEGSYSLVVTAIDRAGNSAQSTVAFTIDRTPPQLTVAGVTDGSVVNVNVTPSFSSTSTDLSSITATLNGAPFVSGTAINGEGNYTLVVVATDTAGNRTTRSLAFVIDKTAPAIALSGVIDQGYVNANVTPVFSATDTDLASVSATLNGTPFLSGTVISAEGGYALMVIALDQAGNQATKTTNFVIDKTPPQITIGGFLDGDYGSANVTPTFSATDADLASANASLDGQPFMSGGVVTSEGAHKITVNATDKAGNAATASATFTIDRTAPVISISGVADGSYSNAASVTPIFSATDANLASVSATLDGAAFASGTGVAAEGTHQLQVIAIDRASNKTTSVVSFTIDRTPPTIVVSGISSGAVYDSAVTPAVQVSDLHLDSTSITLNGATWQSGTAISSDGAYVLAVNASDLAGNTSRASVSFTIQTARFTIQKRLLGHAGAVLALLDAGRCPMGSADVSRVSQFLGTAFAGDLVTATTDDPSFLSGVRSGVYDTLLWIDLAGASDSSCREDLDCATAACSTRTAIERELTELVFAGKAGLVLLRNRTENVPPLREVTGADVDGQIMAAGASFNSPLSAAPNVNLGSTAVRLKLLMATNSGTFTSVTTPASGGPFTAAAMHLLGEGQALTVGFDATAATPASAAIALVQMAAQAVAPAPARLEPLAIAAVEIDVTNPSLRSLTADVRETLPSPLVSLLTMPAGSISAGGARIDWQQTIAQGTTSSFHYLTRLPDASGSWIVTSQAGVLGGSLSASATLKLSLSQKGSDLAVNAVTAATALPSSGHDGAIRSQILALLSSVSSRPVATRADIEKNLSDLLSAVDNAKALKTADPTGVRLALDELIRYWEARWSTL